MTNLNKAALAGLAVMAMCCAGNIGDWPGSIDASFRYRPQDSSTAVVEVLPSSFSKDAGLMPGDLILAVDGTDLTGAAFEDVLAALRGPVGSTARLTVKRGDQILEKAVERRPIKKENKK